MATGIDNLNIQITADTKKAVEAVKNLSDALSALNKQLSGVDTSRLEAATQAAQGFSNAARDIGNSSKDIQNVAQNLQQVGQQASSVKQTANANQELANSATQAAQATREVASSAGGNGGGGAAGGIKNLTISSKQAASVIRALSAGWSGFSGTLKTVGSIIGGVAKKALSSTFNFKKLGAGLKIAKNNAAKFGKELTRIWKMFKLMITRMILRQIISGIGDGFKNLAQYSNTFNASVSLLWNSFRQLGNSIAAAVSPLLNAFAPALNYIIQLVIQAVNAINQLLSALVGLGTWTRAKTLTDSYADSLKKAGGAAKELKKTVLGFDELNQLQDNKNSGGGGTSPSDMFEKAKISDKWKDFADWLKSMWNKADFTELGKLIGEKLLAALKKIPWAKIKRYARKIGKSLATLINGFVEVDDLGRTLGATIAEAINTAFEFVNSFVHNLHWSSIGKFIAEKFNGFFETIDWTLIKDTVVTGLTGLADSINSFVQTFHWDNISDFVKNALDVISSGIKSFFETVDWGDLGTRLGEQLAIIIRETKWEQVGEAIGDMIHSAVEFASNLLGQLSWSDIIDAIKKLFKGIFNKVDEDDREVLGDIVKKIFGFAIAWGIGSIAIEVGKIALAAKIKSIVTTAIGTQTVTAACEGAGGSIIALILKGAATAAEFAGATLAGYLAGNFVSQKYIKDLADNTEHFVKVHGDSSGEIKDYSDRLHALANEYDGVTGSFRLLKDAITGDLFENFTYEVKDAEGNVIALKNAFGEVVESERDVINVNGNVLYTSKETNAALEEMAEKAQNTAKQIPNLREELARTRTSFVGDTHSMATSFEDATKTVTDSTATTQRSISDLSFSIGEETVSMKENYADATLAIQGELCTLEDSNRETMDNIKESFDKDNWTFSGIADGLRESFEAAKEAVKGIWNGIADSMNGTHTFFGSSFSINLPHIYASGGFPEDGLFMANHNELVGRFSNGRTAVANNEQITAGIAQAVYSAMLSANSGGGGSYINNTIEIDGVAIARAVTKGQRSIDRRYNPTMA